MGKVTGGVDIDKLVRPGGRVMLSFADGTEASGDEAYAEELGKDQFIVRTKLERVPRVSNSDLVMIRTADGQVVNAKIKTLGAGPGEITEIQGPVTRGTDVGSFGSG